MFRFPVHISQTTPEEWTASWVDFPDLGSASSVDAQTAFEGLIEQTFSTVSELIAKGRHPQPSPANGRPVVSFSPPGRLQPPHLSRLVSVTRYGSMMTTYSWTNDFAYIG